MADGGQKLTGVIEDDAPWLVGTTLGRSPEEMEFAAKKVPAPSLVPAHSSRYFSSRAAARYNSVNSKDA